MSAWDYTDVSRKAHELVESHGRNAAAYALKLAKAALADAQDEAEFWRAVERSLLPREENELTEALRNS